MTYSAICQAGGLSPNQIVFGVSGANTNSPFDSNDALPATSTTGYASVTTSNANDLIFGDLVGYYDSFSAGTGFTMIKESAYLGAEYEIVSSSQSGLSISFTGNHNPPWYLAIGDAIQQKSGSVSSSSSSTGSLVTGSAQHIFEYYNNSESYIIVQVNGQWYAGAPSTMSVPSWGNALVAMQAGPGTVVTITVMGQRIIGWA